MAGKHKKRTVRFWKLWDEILSTLLTQKDSMSGILRHSNYYMDLKGIYSGEENVTYMYTIDGYPSELELSYRTTLRNVCREGVRISFVSTFEKHKIQWDSPQMKSKLRTWEILENETGDVNEYNLHSNLAMLDSQQWRKDSLTYLSTAEIRRKRKTFRFRSVMFVSGKRGEAFDETIKELESLCRTINIKITQVTLNIQDYMNVFSPFSLMFDENVQKNVGSNVLPDEILARFNSYSQGMVGKNGIYWGTDIYSSFPCLKLVKKNVTDAENWLITAETGGGKSFFVKGLLMQLLGDSNYNGTIMDIEGFEYLPMAAYLSGGDEVVIINMAEGQGAYFDPVEIIVTGDPDIDKDMYSLSTSFTLSVFKTLLGEAVIKDHWVESVLDTAVATAYARRGVAESDIDSWKFSAGLTLKDVYDTIKDMATSTNMEGAMAQTTEVSKYQRRQGIIDIDAIRNDVESKINKTQEYQKAIEVCLAKLSAYFEPSGIRSSLFRNRISVEGIRTAKLVVCSFGMAGKSEANVDHTQMALMQLCAANISYLRSVFSKLQGKFNFKLWEEFQRWGGFPDADKTITVALTGGRKLGDVNIIVTNKVGDMLRDDKFGVFSNITSIAIGCIWDSEIRRELCDRLSMPNMLPELEVLVAKNTDLSAYVDGDTSFANPYMKAFLIGLDKTIFTLSRMTLPRELANSDIFKTGVNIDITQVAAKFTSDDEEGESNAETGDYADDMFGGEDLFDVGDFGG